MLKKISKSFVSMLVCISILGGVVVNAVDWKYPSNTNGFKYQELDEDEYYGSISVKYASKFYDKSYSDTWKWRYGYDLQQHHGSALFTVKSGSGGDGVYGMCVADQHNDPSGDAKTSVYHVDVSGLKNTSISGGNSVFFNASDNFTSTSSSVWNRALRESDLNGMTDKEIFLRIVQMIYEGKWTYYELEEGTTPANLKTGVKLDMSKGHEAARDLKMSKTALARYEGTTYNCEKYLANGTSASAPADGKFVSGLFNTAHSMASYAMTGERFTIFGTMYYSFNQFDSAYTHTVNGKKYSNYATGSYGTYTFDEDADKGTDGYSNSAWRELQLVQYFNMIAASKQIDEDLVYVYVPIETSATSKNPEQWVLFGDADKDVVKYSRYSLFSVNKDDAKGNAMLGAEFTLYSDEDCKNEIAVVTDDDGNGVYSNYSTKENNQKYNALQLLDDDYTNETYKRTIYFKETKAPTKVKMGDTEYTLQETIVDSNVYKAVITYKESTQKLNCKIYNGSTKISDETYSNFDAEITDNDSKTSPSLDKVPLVNNSGSTFIDGASLAFSKKTTNGFNTTDVTVRLYEDNGSYGNYNETEGDITLAWYRYTKADGWGWYTEKEAGTYLGKTYPLKLEEHYGLLETVDTNSNFYKDLEGVYFDWTNTSDDWKKNEDKSWYYIFDTTDAKVGDDLSFTATNDLIKGSIDITKIVEDGSSAEGKEFNVYFVGKNDSTGTPIKVGTIKIDKNGKGELKDIPLGYYQLEETKESLGNRYALRWAEGVKTTNNNRAVIYVNSSTVSAKVTAYNDVSTEFKVTKVDEWSYVANASVVDNGNKVPGVEFTLYKDLNGNGELDEEEKAEDNAKVVKDTDKDGVVEFNKLTTGTYFLKETATVDGYYLSDSVKTIKIENSYEDYAEVVADKPYKAPILIYKVDSKDNDWYLRNAAFEIYNDVNSNGKYDEDIDTPVQVLCSDGTFRNVVMRQVTVNNKPAYRTSIDNDGVLGDCSVKFGDYVIFETVAPENHKLTKEVVAVTVDRADTTVIKTVSPVEATLKNDQDFKTELMVPETTAKSFIVGEKVKMTDYVYYTNLIVGNTYKVKGTLYAIDEDGKTVNTGVTKTVTFVATDDGTATLATDGTMRISGKIGVTFDVDTTKMVSYEKVVAAEEMNLLYKDKEYKVGIHFDINDDLQSIPVPKISTTLVDKDTKSKVVACDTDTTLVDTVSYKNLIDGKTYTFEGILMDKKTNKPLLDENGKEIKSTLTYTVDKTKGTSYKTLDDGVTYVSGKVDVEFKFNSTILDSGSKLVAFEEVKFEGKTVSVHTDINDEGQTVHTPGIKTKAIDKETASKSLVYSPTTVIKDTVMYSGLVKGKTYTVSGILMDKDTGEALLDADGNEIKGETTFIAPAEDGSVEVEFTVDTTVLPGKQIVVFEDLYTEGRKVCIHADITDEDQTTSVPEASTLAKSAKGTKTVNPSAQVTIIDTISYKNLTPNTLYRAEATLYKNDGTQLFMNGSPLLVVKEFIPDSPNGTVDVKITFNGSEFKSGDVIVVFENIYDVATDSEKEKGTQTEDKLIGKHEDLTDTDQSITFKVPATGEISARYTNIGISLVVSVTVGGLLNLFLTRKKKNGEA